MIFKITLNRRAENQLIYPNPEGSKLIFFTPLSAGQAGFREGATEENHTFVKVYC